MGQLSNSKGLSTSNFQPGLSKRRFHCKPLFIILVILSYDEGRSQSIVWNFDSATGTDLPAVTTSNVTASTLWQGNNNGTTILLNSSSSSTGYTVASGSYNAEAAALPASFDAATSTYFEFTLTPDQGYSLAISRITSVQDLLVQDLNLMLLDVLLIRMLLTSQEITSQQIQNGIGTRIPDLLSLPPRQ